MKWVFQNRNNVQTELECHHQLDDGVFVWLQRLADGFVSLTKRLAGIGNLLIEISIRIVFNQWKH